MTRDSPADETEASTDPRELELVALRARVAELEAQLAEQSRVTNDLVATAQERLYWFDRWGVDPGRLMARPWAEPTLAALKKGRSVFRVLRATKRRLVGPK